MSKDILHRAIGAIQRDRLSGFVKDASDLEEGCFQYSAVSCHNYLYPDEVLPKGVGDRLFNPLTKGKGTKVTDVIRELKRLQPDLKIKVDHIVNHSNLSAEEVQELFDPADRVPVTETDNGHLGPIAGKSTAITFLSTDDEEGGHFIPLVENPRFDEEGQITGGNTEYQRIKNKYKAAISFIIERSEE